jgi:hypothetical protein
MLLSISAYSGSFGLMMLLGDRAQPLLQAVTQVFPVQGVKQRAAELEVRHL